MKHTVVVTGGTKGLGREISLAFARLGHSVIALYANDFQAAERIESEFTNMGSTSVVLKHDVTSDSHALKNCPLLKDAESLVFIHNACADFTPVPLHQLSWNDFEKNLSVFFIISRKTAKNFFFIKVFDIVFYFSFIFFCNRILLKTVIFREGI